MAKAIWGLDKFAMFKGLNPGEIQQVSTIVTKNLHASGDIITDHASRSRDIYTLIEGRVDIMSLNGVPLYRIAPGETFGELALVPNLKRTAVAVAREDSWTLVMNISHLETFGNEYPEIYRIISQNIVNSLGLKLARANKLIELLKSEMAKTMRK